MTAAPALLVHGVGATAQADPSQVANAIGEMVASREVEARTVAIAAGLARHPGIGFAPVPRAAAGEAATLADLLSRAHDPGYLAALREGEPPGRDAGAIGPVARSFAAPETLPDTPLELGSFVRAEAAALAALRAAGSLVRGEARHSWALCRPPGHHAGRAFLGGYCFLNNAAVAALALSHAGLGPVHLLDIDYHVGNGTSDALAAHPEIGFTSLHAATDGAFPFVAGLAPAHPAHRYQPFANPPDADRYLAELDSALTAAGGAGVLVVSLGFDIVEGDPHGGWTLPPAIFAAVGARLAQAGRPLCIIQEGGYRLEVLADCAAALAEGLLAAVPACPEGPEPEMPEDSPDSLRPWRERIDALDDALIDLLAERLEICAEVAAYKRAHGIPMSQPQRVEQVKARCAARAAARGLGAGFARELYDRIIGEACALETRIIGS